MSIYGLSSVQSSGGQTDSSQRNVMGKSDFLNLLVVQMQAQDPLNPMDATGFTAQLAQFSSLEQLQNVNSSLEDLALSQSVMTNSQAVGFIGKTITALGNVVSVQDGENSPIEISLEADAAAVYASIYNADGEFVRDLELGPMNAGNHSVEWDLENFLGDSVSDGLYSYEISAVDSSGNTIGATTYSSGTVTGVNFRNGLAYLMVGDQEVYMGNVVEVSP